MVDDILASRSISSLSFSLLFALSRPKDWPIEMDERKPQICEANRGCERPSQHWASTSWIGRNWGHARVGLEPQWWSLKKKCLRNEAPLEIVSPFRAALGRARGALCSMSSAEARTCCLVDQSMAALVFSRSDGRVRVARALRRRRKR